MEEGGATGRVAGGVGGWNRKIGVRRMRKEMHAFRNKFRSCRPLGSKRHLSSLETRKAAPLSFAPMRKQRRQKGVSTAHYHSLGQEQRFSVFTALPWCSGYHIRLTRGRSPVRSRAETIFLDFCTNRITIQIFLFSPDLSSLT